MLPIITLTALVALVAAQSFTDSPQYAAAISAYADNPQAVAAISAYFAMQAKNSLAPKFSEINPAATEIAQAAATAVSNSFADKPVVKGQVFDKFYQVWLENTDKDKAREQPDLVELQKQGITLTNYFGLTHPSEPNYIGAVGGDYFGIFDDAFLRIPENVSTVVDLLDTKNISWAEYQEHQPYSGFQGQNFSRQTDFAPDYVRRHNPLVSYDSVVSKPQNLGYLKNYTEFEADLRNNDLPQWAFFTPNVTNDGHDTDISFSGRYVTNWIQPLLNNSAFSDNSLIIVTFDESETYSTPNTVLAILLGGAVPDNLRGTTDNTFYDHYSNLATVQANWELPHLGRNDVNANVFQFVADQLNIENRNVSTQGLFRNSSENGYFTDNTVPIVAPNLTAVGISGNRILPRIAAVWGNSNSTGSNSSSTVAAANTTGAANATASATASGTANGATLVTLSGAALVGVIAALLM